MRLKPLPPLKPVRFLGTSLSSLRAFSKEARNEAGDQLLLVQAGEMPQDWKTMPDIGSGVFEIRIHSSGEYRVIYVAKFVEAIYVLHAFEKKTEKTRQRDLHKAREEYAKMLKERRK
jgi:phage-related protein